MLQNKPQIAWEIISHHRGSSACKRALNINPFRIKGIPFVLVMCTAHLLRPLYSKILDPPCHHVHLSGGKIRRGMNNVVHSRWYGSCLWPDTWVIRMMAHGGHLFQTKILMSSLHVKFTTQACIVSLILVPVHSIYITPLCKSDHCYTACFPIPTKVLCGGIA